MGVTLCDREGVCRCVRMHWYNYWAYTLLLSGQSHELISVVKIGERPCDLRRLNSYEYPVEIFVWGSASLSHHSLPSRPFFLPLPATFPFPYSLSFPPISLPLSSSLSSNPPSPFFLLFPLPGKRATKGPIYLSSRERVWWLQTSSCFC